MLINLAELAAYVRDVKPESDVHSNLPNHRSNWKNNGFNAADVFAACAEPTADNQYTTSKPTLRLCFSFRLRLPLMRNRLLTTSTP